MVVTRRVLRVRTELARQPSSFCVAWRTQGRLEAQAAPSSSMPSSSELSELAVVEATRAALAADGDLAPLRDHVRMQLLTSEPVALPAALDWALCLPLLPPGRTECEAGEAQQQRPQRSSSGSSRQHRHGRRGRRSRSGGGSHPGPPGRGLPGLGGDRERVWVARVAMVTRVVTPVDAIEPWGCNHGKWND